MTAKRLTKEIAEQFLANDDSVDLSEFTELDDDAAESLSNFNGVLYLDGLTELPSGVAHGLSTHTGTISLNGLMELSDGAVAEFANDECAIHHLFLTGLTTLSDWAAEELVSWKKGGSGPSLYWIWSNLPASTADILENHPSADNCE